MARFTDKTVLLTGAAGGMGSSHARGLIAEGANVLLADIRQDAGRQLADELGDRARFVLLDVSDSDAWSRAVAEAEQRFGGLDALVNNAGVLSPSALIDDYDVEDWAHVLAVNLTGPWLGMRAAIPALRRNGGGAIVNIASTSSHVGTPFISPYVASKWGLRGITQSAALELGRDAIRVNSISPGVVDTPLITQPLRAGEVAVSEHFSPEPFAIKRLADPADITRLVLYLASEDAAFITGSDFVADGGLLLGPAVAADQTQN